MSKRTSRGETRGWGPDRRGDRAGGGWAVISIQAVSRLPHHPAEGVTLNDLSSSFHILIHL